MNKTLINNKLRRVMDSMSPGTMFFINDTGGLVSETFMCRDVCLQRTGRYAQNNFKGIYFCMRVTDYEKDCFESNVKFLHELEEVYKFKQCRAEVSGNSIAFDLDKRWYKPLMFSFFTWFVRLMLVNKRDSFDGIFKPSQEDVRYTNKINYSTLSSAKYTFDLRSYLPIEFSKLAKNLYKILARNKANSAWPKSSKDASYQGFCSFIKSFNKGHRDRIEPLYDDVFVAARKRTKEVLANEGITITL